MMAAASFVIDVMATFAYAILIFMILREFVPLRFHNKAAFIIELFLLMWIGGAIIYPEEVTGTFGCLTGLAAILVLFHKGGWHLKVSAAVITYPAVMAISFVTQDIGQMIWMYGFDREMPQDGQTFLYLLMRVVKIPAGYFIYRCVKEWMPGATGMMTRRMWLVLDLISAASFAGIITIIAKCTAVDSYFAWPACIAVLITSMGCCYLCTYMAKIVRADMEIKSMQYQQSYYKEMEQSQQTIRRMRHDMRNHLSIVSTLLREEEYEKAAQYLKELDQEFSAQVKAYCPNQIVNAVLSAKKQKSDESGIQCEYQVDLRELPPVEDIDLCSVFANTLDNAIEACRKMKKTAERKISLKTRCVNGYFIYEIVNSKDNRILEKNGSIVTDKEDKTSHGIGLGNVREIVRKYQGEMEIKYTEEEFRVVVMIPSLQKGVCAPV